MPRHDESLKGFLTLRPLVFVGLISYSLYLWHWPAQVFSHYWLTGQSPYVARFVMVACSVVVAWLSWRFIEVPFRARNVVAPRRKIVTSAIAATAAAVAAGTLIARQDPVSRSGRSPRARPRGAGCEWT